MKKKHSSLLGPVDSAFLYVESPETPMNIGSMTLFEGKFEYHELAQFIDRRIQHAALYHKRVVQAPLNLSEFMWVYDPDFNIENHVFEVQLDAPGTEEQLRELAGYLVSGMLDRNKPLWEIYLINGLQGDRSALFFKVHHCMVDGLAAVELFTLMLDLTPEIQPVPERRAAFQPPPLPDTTQLLKEATIGEIPYKWKVLKKLGRDTLSLGSVFLDKEKRRKALYGIANLLNDNLGTIKKLGINGKNSGEQSVAWIEFPLSEVRAIKASQGASVNDVMLYVLSTGVEMYLADRGDESDSEFIRILIPVSMREEEEKESFGNRISVLPIDVKLDDAKALDRLKAISEYTSVMKDSSLSNAVDLILTLPSLALPIAQPLIWGVAPKAFSFIAHTWCTNVAGPQIPVYLMGRQMLHTYGYFPLNPSMGLACVCLSYNQKISMNLVADKAIVPDVAVLRDFLRDAYVRLRRAAKVPESEPITLTKVETPPTPEVVKVPEPAAAGTEPIEGGEGEPLAEMQTGVAKPSSNGQLKLFSEEWAKAYKEAINGNPEYQKASTDWKAGPLAFVMNPSPRYGYTTPAAVILDLDQGVCHDARALTPQAALAEATFVIEGDYENWNKLLSGAAQPLPMLMRGKLKLRKGSVSKLLPYTKSAQELIKSAQNIKS